MPSGYVRLLRLDIDTHTARRRREEEEKSEFSFFLAGWKRTDEVIITNRIHPEPHKERRTNQIENKKNNKTPKISSFFDQTTREQQQRVIVNDLARLCSYRFHHHGHNARDGERRKMPCGPLALKAFFLFFKCE